MRRRFDLVAALLLLTLIAAGCSSGVRITQPPAPPRTPNASDVQRNEARTSLDAFVALLAAEDRAFRIDEEASISTPVGAVRATTRMDIVGEDIQGDMRLSAAGADPVRFRFILVGNGLWAREGSAAWKKVPRGTLSATDALEVLAAGVVPRHLDFREQKTVDGKLLNHFASRAPIAYDSTSAELAGSINRIDVYVQEDGTPVTVEVEYTGIYQLVPAVKGRMTAEATMSFSRVGKPVKIEPPS